MSRLNWFRGVAAAALLALTPASAKACDVALILLADRSGSVDANEYRLQMEATAAALRSEDVLRAIGRGSSGRIYATFGHFADNVEWRTPWTLLMFRTQIENFSATVGALPRNGHGGTMTGLALNAAIDRFESVPEPCERLVVDVSTDDVGSDTEALKTARERAERMGVIVNAIMIGGDSDPAYAENYNQMPTDALVEWAQENLITGTGSFAFGATFQTYHRAIRNKLALEIAGEAPNGRFASLRTNTAIRRPPPSN